MKELLEELTNLLKQQREEAVKGFARHCVVKAKKHQGDMFDGFMFDEAEEYLTQQSGEVGWVCKKVNAILEDRHELTPVGKKEYR
jgi:uncharacterized protein involved in exopolysaccharide biosynthesis